MSPDLRGGTFEGHEEETATQTLDWESNPRPFDPSVHGLNALTTATSTGFVRCFNEIRII